MAADGTSLQVVVPAWATSGMVRLDREASGPFLQIVPTLSDVDLGVNRTYDDGQLTLRGSGFVVRRPEGPNRVYRLDPTALEQLDRRVDWLHTFWNARYGWPYRADPLSPHLLTTSRRPNRGRGQRGRSERPIVFEVTEDNDLWQWISD